MPSIRLREESCTCDTLARRKHSARKNTSPLLALECLNGQVLEDSSDDSFIFIEYLGKNLADQENICIESSGNWIFQFSKSVVWILILSGHPKDSLCPLIPRKLEPVILGAEISEFSVHPASHPNSLPVRGNKVVLLLLVLNAELEYKPSPLPREKK